MSFSQEMLPPMRRRSTTHSSPGQQRNSFTGVGGKVVTEERNAVIERILSALDPNITSTPVYFDYKKDARTFRFHPNTDHTVFHLSLDGCTVRTDAPEAVQQKEDAMRRVREFNLALEAERNPELVDEGVSTKILKNQFNYRDRGSQTMNPVCHEKMVMTDPPPSIILAGTASAWEIFDAYEADRLANERAAVAKKAASSSAARGSGGSSGGAGDERGGMDGTVGADGRGRGSGSLQTSTAFLNAMCVLERMINQNDCYDVIDDFKYWEDLSDRYKEEGNLLPLWRFTSARAKKRRSVTSIAINPLYSDLFAVGYGMYEFQRQGAGFMECFTLKNAVPSTPGDAIYSTPEFSFAFESGVMCLAFHPTQCSIIACGLYDGSIHVLDLVSSSADRGAKPMYVSTIKTGKHTDPVWGLHWLTATPALQLLSISSDSRIVSWTFSKREVLSKELMRLTVTDAASSSPRSTGAAQLDPETAAANVSGGMCFDVLTDHSNCMVLGTTEGAVHVCDKAGSGRSSETYVGHHMAVYAARWNPFRKDIFLTCSADWTVRLWKCGTHTPLLTFDLGDVVGDVAWAPYTSTVFAAVTATGKVMVYDLSTNRTQSLCAQTVVRNARLTHIVFSHREPIIFAGDSRGSVLTLKLSPNLRRTCKPQRGEPDDAETLKALEVDKLDRILEIILKDRELLGPKTP